MSVFTIAMVSFKIDFATYEYSILQKTLGVELLEEHVLGLYEVGHKRILQKAKKHNLN